MGRMANGIKMTLKLHKWEAISASELGSSHLRKNLPCQDANKFDIFEYKGSPILIAAVADGAGSASHSQEGAQIATAQTVSEIRRKIEHDGLPEAAKTGSFWHEILQFIQEQIKLRADELEVNYKQLSATVIMAIATPSSITVAQIGDGAAVGYIDGKLTLLTEPQRGEYANSTHFVTSSGAKDYLQTRYWKGRVSEIVIFTDGLQLFALPKSDGVLYEDFLFPLCKFIREVQDSGEASSELKKFLYSEKIQQHTDDDLTLLLASYRDEQESFAEDEQNLTQSSKEVLDTKNIVEELKQPDLEKSEDDRFSDFSHSIEMFNTLLRLLQKVFTFFK
jgi:hypothetical protein